LCLTLTSLWLSWSGLIICCCLLPPESFLVLGPAGPMDHIFLSHDCDWIMWPVLTDWSGLVICCWFHQHNHSRLWALWDPWLFLCLMNLTGLWLVSVRWIAAGPCHTIILFSESFRTHISLLLWLSCSVQSNKLLLPLLALLFLVLDPIGTHDQIFVRSKTIYMFQNGVSSLREEELDFLSRRHYPGPVGPCYMTWTLMENAVSNSSSIVACLSIATGTCLLSHCLARMCRLAPLFWL
jgi:hypothetical protein